MFQVGTGVGSEGPSPVRRQTGWLEGPREERKATVSCGSLHTVLKSL